MRVERPSLFQAGQVHWLANRYTNFIAAIETNMRHREERWPGFGNRDFASLVDGKPASGWLVIAAAFLLAMYASLMQA